MQLEALAHFAAVAVVLDQAEVFLAGPLLPQGEEILGVDFRQDAAAAPQIRQLSKQAVQSFLTGPLLSRKAAILTQRGHKLSAISTQLSA
jgi:hypothetical protein